MGCVILPNLFVYGTLLSRYRNPWINSIENGKLKIILNSYKRIPAILDEYMLVWRREMSYPYIIPEPNYLVIGEVILDIPDDVINVIDTYEGYPRLYLREEVYVRTSLSSREKAYVYVWRKESKHNKDEVFLTLLPDSDIPEWIKNEVKSYSI